MATSVVLRRPGAPLLTYQTDGGYMKRLTMEEYQAQEKAKILYKTAHVELKRADTADRLELAVGGTHGVRTEMSRHEALDLFVALGEWLQLDLFAALCSWPQTLEADKKVNRARNEAAVQASPDEHQL